MPIDPDAEELVPIPASLDLFPGHAGISRATLYSWITFGLRGPRVKLEHVRVGGKLYTTRAAVDRFLAATNGADRTAT